MSKPGVGMPLDAEAVNALKQGAWKALNEGQPHPDLSALLERGVTPLDAHYLLERWASLTIYDAFNLETPNQKKLLSLPGASKHFVVYEYFIAGEDGLDNPGSRLVMAPKDLFSHERTLADGLQTAEAVAAEAFRRNWAVDLVGYEKYRRAAGIMLHALSLQNGYSVEILNFDLSLKDEELVKHKALNPSAGLRLD